MGRHKKQTKNKHMIGYMRVTTSASSTEGKPMVFIYSIDFDFSGITTVNEYEKFNEQLYKYMYRKYPQDKKIININLPDVGCKSMINYFNKKTHHCSIEVFLLNEKNLPFDEWENELVADDLKPICDDIENLFWKNGFLLKVSVKKGANLFG